MPANPTRWRCRDGAAGRCLLARLRRHQAGHAREPRGQGAFRRPSRACRRHRRMGRRKWRARQDGAACDDGLGPRHHERETFEDDLGFLFKDWFKARGAGCLRSLLSGRTARNWSTSRTQRPRKLHETCGERLEAANRRPHRALMARTQAGGRWVMRSNAKGAHPPIRRGRSSKASQCRGPKAAAARSPSDPGLPPPSGKTVADPLRKHQCSSYRGIFDLSRPRPGHLHPDHGAIRQRLLRPLQRPGRDMGGRERDPDPVDGGRWIRRECGKLSPGG